MTFVDQPTADLPRAYLRPCVLLLLAEGATHGYDMLQQLGDLGLDKPDLGGLYRALRAMEQEGLVRSEWQPSDAGPPRRTYALAGEGWDWLHAWSAALRHARDSLDSYLARYERVAPAAGRATADA